MKLRSILPIAIAGLLGSTSAVAACPPLSVYHVAGITAEHSNLAYVARLLFQGTAWHASVQGPAAAIPVSLNNVAGPLDKVLDAVVGVASTDRYTVRSVTDAAACTVTFAVTPRPAAPAAAVATTAPAAPAKLTAGPIETASHDAVPAAPPEASRPVATDAKPAAVARPVVTAASTPAYTMPAGEMLSTAMRNYVRSLGWTLRWTSHDNYMLDAPFPIPAGYDVVKGVRYIEHAYHLQGGLQHTYVWFATPNRVVAAVPVSARTQSMTAAPAAEENRQ